MASRVVVLCKNCRPPCGGVQRRAAVGSRLPLARGALLGEKQTSQGDETKHGHDPAERTPACADAAPCLRDVIVPSHVPPLGTQSADLELLRDFSEFASGPRVPASS